MRNKVSRRFLRRCPNWACLFILGLSWLMLASVARAEDPLSSAQKKYQKEMKALWGMLELADSSMANAVVAEDETIVASFNLSNKTNREIPVPLALGFPSERGGVLGWPVWSFVSVDKRGKPPLTRKGVLAYAFKIDPNGKILIDASKVAGMTPGEIGLAPGAYQMTVTFYPFVGSVGAGLVSKPFKFVVKPSEHADANGDPSKALMPAAGAAGSAAKSRSATGAALGTSQANTPSLLPYISFGKMEFASDSVQIGTPLNCSFDLVVDPARPLPALETQGDAPKVRLNCSWSISKLGSQKSAKAKTRVSGSIINVSGKALDELRTNGTCTLKLLNETSGLPPGSYELAVWLWQEGGQAKQARGDTKAASFRISK